MKNTFIQMGILIALTGGLTGCEKELMNYEGKDAVIYFDVRYGDQTWMTEKHAHQNYSFVAFGRTDSSTVETKLRIAISGNLKDYDRPFQVEVVADSTTASCPDEYEPVTRDHVIPAGENHTYVSMKFHKTERMQTDTLRVQLRIIPGEHFDFAFSRIGLIPGLFNDTETALSRNEDPSVHSVFVNDIPIRPAGWNDYQLGDFTVSKYLLMIELSGWPKSHFEDITKMQVGRRQLIQDMMLEYLTEQYKKGREYWVIDDDGTMMWVRGCAWDNHTDPNTMSGN